MLGATDTEASNTVAGGVVLSAQSSVLPFPTENCWTDSVVGKKRRDALEEEDDSLPQMEILNPSMEIQALEVCCAIEIAPL